MHVLAAIWQCNQAFYTASRLHLSRPCVKIQCYSLGKDLMRWENLFKPLIRFIFPTGKRDSSSIMFMVKLLLIFLSCNLREPKLCFVVMSMEKGFSGFNVLLMAWCFNLFLGVLGFHYFIVGLHCNACTSMKPAIPSIIQFVYNK